MSSPKPKPYLMKITPYKQGKSKVDGKKGVPEKIIKLSSNENSLGPSPQAIAAYRTLFSLHRYPDGSASRLREAIAKTHDLDAERIVCGAGSDELINLLIHSYAGEGDEVLYTEHGFLMYKIYALAHGATPVTAKEKNYTADVDAILAAVTARTKLVFLANPNNPTGTYLPAREVNRLRNGLASHIILVLDAAYAEYVTADDYDAGKALVEGTDNTVMLRTFSKIYGLSALRLGWAYAPPAVVDALSRVRSPFNVSSASMVAGVAAVEDVEYTHYVVEYTVREREKLIAELEKLGLTVTPSQCNFLLIHFPDTAGKTAHDANLHLLSEGIIPREVAEYGLPNCLRITIGMEEENAAVVKSLSGFLS